MTKYSVILINYFVTFSKYVKDKENREYIKDKENRGEICLDRIYRVQLISTIFSQPTHTVDQFGINFVQGKLYILRCSFRVGIG